MIRYLLILLLFSISQTLLSQTQIIQSGDIWKFYDQGNLNSPNWKQLAYDDTLWPTGASELGYGDGDEETIIGFGGNPNNRFITAYFRKSISLESPRDLTCSLKIDDGAVVYLNGIEVFRNNLPTGVVSYNTLALNSSNENAWYNFIIPYSQTNAGNNILAVEMHQNSVTSSDLSFDFQLIAQLPPPPPPALGIYINEIMASNQSSVVDNAGEHSDWIEIFNNTSEVLDLANYYLSDDEDNKLKFRFTNVLGQLTIPSFSYKIIFASGDITRGNNHTNFSLSKEGEVVILTNPDGTTIVDSLHFDSQRTDVSYGRLPQTGTPKRYFSPSSPNQINSFNNAYLGITPSPTFTHLGGTYQNNFNLGLQHTNGSVKIYYSLDSSEPDSNRLIPQSFSYKNNFPGSFLSQSYRSFLYTGPITMTNKTSSPNSVSQKSSEGKSTPSYFPTHLINKGNVIRASATLPGYLSSDIVTNSYFVWANNSYNLPIVSLSIPEKSLFDYNSGFYTPGSIFENTNPQNFFCPKGNYSSEDDIFKKQGNFEYILNGQSVSNRRVNAQIHGGCSTQSRRKSLRIESEMGTYGTHFFPNYSNLDYTTILLRTGGNDSERTFMTDMVYHDLVRGLDFGIQDAQPAVCFLNGEYWGLKNIRERIDENYLKLKFQVDEDSVDLIHIKGQVAELENGSYSNYNSLISFLNGHTFTTQYWYDSLTKLIDVNNLIDYHIAEIFAANTDWPQSNLRMWRSTSRNSANKFQDAKWRFVLFDLDFGLWYSSVNLNMLTSLTNPSNADNIIFRKINQNPTFRNLFMNRFLDLLNSYYLPNRSTNLLNHWKSTLSPFVPEHTLRWKSPTDLQNWEGFVTNVKSYLLERPQIQKNHLIAQYGISGTYNLTVKSANLTEGFVKVNSINILNSTPGVGANPTIWTGQYFDNIPLRIVAKAQKGYKFTHWIHNGLSIPDSAIIIVTSSSVTYEAFFEETLISENPLPIAYMADNCTYSMTNWASSSAIGSSPLAMKFAYFDTEDPPISANIVGFTNGAFNGTSRTRINGNNEKGFSFINTGSSAQDGYLPSKLGGVLMALNTTDIDSLKISWKGRTVKASSRKYAVRLQYRIGDIQNFSDFIPPVEYSGAMIDDDSMTFNNIYLPSSALDKPYVQLLWRYYFTGNGISGSRDELGVDDIKIKTVKVQDTTLLNTVGVFQNPERFYLSGAIEGASIVKKNAHKSILIEPGFKADNGVVFEANIIGCSHE